MRRAAPEEIRWFPIPLPAETRVEDHGRSNNELEPDKHTNGCRTSSLWALSSNKFSDPNEEGIFVHHE